MASCLDVFICVYAANNKRDNHGTYLNHMQYDRQAKTSQIFFIHKIEEPATMKMSDLECSTDGQEDRQ
jgi:hypothetical protein